MALGKQPVRSRYLLRLQFTLKSVSHTITAGGLEKIDLLREDSAHCFSKHKHKQSQLYCPQENIGKHSVHLAEFQRTVKSD